MSALPSYIAPLHPREADRLATLEFLGLLDSAPEPAFDALVELACSLLDVPIALVSLVAEDRQWFKARSGIDVAEVSRDVAFCAHAIHERERLVVADARQDPRFSGNPLVQGEPNVVFYAGAVIRGPDQLPLGTVCVIDHSPRELSPERVAMLDHLARVCERLIAAHYDARQLERRLEEVARYGEALARAQAERDQLERFLFHDLNGRLTQVGISAELLVDRQLAESRRERLADAVCSGVEKASTLVARLRDVRGEQDQLLSVQYREVDLSVLIHEVLLSTEGEAERRGVTIHVEAPRGTVARVDPHLLERVLANLVSNGLRYGPPDTRLELAAGAGDDGWWVAVEDQGPGVEEADRERIFEPRVRVGPDAEQGTGEGLGLAFCRMAASAWGGRVRVEAAPGGGARFVVEG